MDSPETIVKEAQLAAERRRALTQGMKRETFKTTGEMVRSNDKPELPLDGNKYGPARTFGGTGKDSLAE